MIVLFCRSEPMRDRSTSKVALESKIYSLLYMNDQRRDSLLRDLLPKLFEYPRESYLASEVALEPRVL